MENEKLKSYKEYVKSFIIDRLEDHEDNTFCDGYELANSMTESINIDGSATYSTYKAKQYIKEWFEEVGEFIEDYKANFGEAPHHNPFESPELFHCLMVIVGVEKMLSNLEEADKMQEEFTLTSELIKCIIEELESI